MTQNPQKNLSHRAYGTCAAFFTVFIEAAMAASCGPSNSSPGIDAATDSTAGQDAHRDTGPRPDWYVPDALVSVCGNAVVEGDEVCDDGNTISGDGCNATCTSQDNWDFVANTHFAGDQNEVAMTCSDATAIAVWTDWAGLDGDGASIQMRWFGSDGIPLTTSQGDDHDIQVNEQTTGHQHQARVASLPSGGIVVVWTNSVSGQDGDISMRIFANDGSAVTSEATVNTTLAGDQQTPDVAVASDGTIVVVWADGSGQGPDNSSYGIKARLFDSAGTPVQNAQTGDTSEFQANSVTAGVQRDPTVSPTGNNGFLVAWSDQSGQLDSDGFGIAATVLDATGWTTGPGADFLVNSTTTGQQFMPRAALQPGNGLVVVWADESLTEDLQEFGIRARLLTDDGQFRQNNDGTDEDFQVNTTTAGSQELPAVAALSSGDFLTLWQDWSGADGSGSGIRARALTSNARPVIFLYSDSADDFGVDTTFVGSQRAPVVCSFGSWFMTAWVDESEHAPDGSGSGIRYRLVTGW